MNEINWTAYKAEVAVEAAVEIAEMLERRLRQ